MEQDWVRAEEVLSVSLDTARSLLAPFGLEPVSLHTLTEGKANTNVRLKLTDGRTVVLRLYQREKAKLLLEMALLRQFHAVLPVASVVAADEDAAWLLLEFLPGRTLQKAATDGAHDEILAAAPVIGVALAKIAAVRFDTAGFLDANLTVTGAWPSVIDGLEGYLGMCLARPVLTLRVDDDLVGGVRGTWTAARPRLEELTRQPNLSHADFKPSNLLIDTGRLSGILDWEFAHSGTWLLDAGQLLRHRGELPEDFGAEVEAGLREGGLDVPEDWQRLAGVIDLMSLVDFLGRDACSEETVRHIERLIHTTIASF
jgi:aminoglycoside phosphotransferase (APT) family kinase protein